MIGDVRIILKRIFRQQVFCKHDYKVVQRKDLQGGSYRECITCGKISR